MSISGINSIEALLSNNSYPGRGIMIGQSADGKNAMIAYFIMGRSANSRNRIFERYEGGMRTKAFDESKLEDPSLIIYNPFLERKNIDIVTNGDQTDTIYNFLEKVRALRRHSARVSSSRIIPTTPPEFRVSTTTASSKIPSPISSQSSRAVTEIPRCVTDTFTNMHR